MMEDEETKKNTFFRTLAKRFLYQAQDGFCHICRQKLPEKFGSPMLTIDHIWPSSKSVSHSKYFGNVLLAHRKCNQIKGDRMPTTAEVKALFAANRRMGLPMGQTRVWDGEALQKEPQHDQTIPY